MVIFTDVTQYYLFVNVFSLHRIHIFNTFHGVGVAAAVCHITQNTHAGGQYTYFQKLWIPNILTRCALQKMLKYFACLTNK